MSASSHTDDVRTESSVRSDTSRDSALDHVSVAATGSVPGGHLLPAEEPSRNRLLSPVNAAELKLDIWTPRLTPLEALVSQFLAPGVFGAILFFMLDRTDWAVAARRDNLVGGSTWPAMLGQAGLAFLLATFWLDMFRRQQTGSGQAGVWLDAISTILLGFATVWIGNSLWPALALALVGVACLARSVADWQARSALGRDVALSSCGMTVAQIAIVLTAIVSSGSPETQAIAVIACAVVGLMAEAVAEQPAPG
jgi:hypothetical protein